MSMLELEELKVIKLVRKKKTKTINHKLHKPKLVQTSTQPLVISLIHLGNEECHSANYN